MDLYNNDVCIFQILDQVFYFLLLFILLLKNKCKNKLW
jgi:hypothetical protein